MNQVSQLFANAAFDVKEAGAVLFEEETPGTVMYVVRSGEVAIRVGGRTVETVAAGGIVGEMALLDNAPRSAAAVAVNRCEVVAIDQKQFLFLVQQTPFFALEVMRIMASRLRAMNRAG
jgi:CRP-like cAMP-binding protein